MIWGTGHTLPLQTLVGQDSPSPISGSFQCSVLSWVNTIGKCQGDTWRGKCSSPFQQRTCGSQEKVNRLTLWVWPDEHGREWILGTRLKPSKIKRLILSQILQESRIRQSIFLPYHLLPFQLGWENSACSLVFLSITKMDPGECYGFSLKAIVSSGIPESKAHTGPTLSKDLGTMCSIMGPLPSHPQDQTEVRMS